jgi:hypothetical protein
MARHRVDGLVIEADVPLPGLPAAAGGPFDWSVEVRRGPLPADDGGVEWTGRIDSEEGTWARYGRCEGRSVVRLEGLCELSADPARRAATVRHAGEPARDALVLRRCLPYLVARTGRLAFHAACVAFPGGAVVLCAHAGTGKSTLATAFDARGVPVLADDHVAVDAEPGKAPVAHASVPWIEVSGETRTAFRPEVPADGPRTLPYRTPRPAAAVRVAEVAFLRRGPALAVTPLPAAEAFPRLLRDVLFVGDPRDASEHEARFDAMKRLLEAVPACEIAVPDGLPALGQALAPLAARWATPATRPVRA